MLWTEEAIEVLRRLALEGRSGRAIAMALGAPSRAAVIGKANWLGIKLNGGVNGSAPDSVPEIADRPWLTAVARAKPITSKGASKPVSCKRALAPAVPREPRKPRWIFAGAEIGEMRRVRFEDIREVECRWPLGDPLSEDFSYCGLQPAPGRSYCAGHCRMAYQPPKAAAEALHEERWSREGASLRQPP